MRKVLILLFSLFVFSACDPCNQKLILINNTEDSIYFDWSTNTVPTVNTYWELLYPYDTVKPCYMGGWIYAINRESIDSTLHIFIFPMDRITDDLKNSKEVQLTDEQIKNSKYERLSFTVKELDSLNWTVVYRGQNK